MSYEEIAKNIQEKYKITATTTFADLVKTKAEVLGDQVYLTYVRDFDKGIDEEITYRDMHIRSNRVANALINSGLKRGDGISLYQINSPEFLYVLFGAYKVGIYVVLVNTGLKGDGLQFIIDHSDSKMLVTHWSLLDNCLKIKDQLPKVNNILVDMNEAPDDFELPDGTSSLQEFMDASDEDTDVRTESTDIATLIYTSGTTGLPKATTFFHKEMYGFRLIGLMYWSSNIAAPGSKLFTCLPLFHGNALQLCAMPGYHGEIPVVLGKRFSASRFWDIVRKYEVTQFNVLGSMSQYLMKQPERPNDKHHMVKIVGSAATPKEIVRAFEERFNVKIHEGYGAVDGGRFSLGTGGSPDAPVGSMGKPPADMIAEIMDDELNILSSNEVGELVFLVKEEEKEERKVSYYKNPEASAARIQVASDGRSWFLSGDLTTKDENGWFFFVDR
ncbi:MAG: AMP-binding protein, partial [Promethearchaeota archaeon]